MRKRAAGGGGWLEERDGEVLVHVRALPGSERPGVGAVDPWRGGLSVRVRSRPQEGRANEELRGLLAAALGVKPSAVELVRGASARDKILRVAGLDAATARARLEGST